MNSNSGYTTDDYEGLSASFSEVEQLAAWLASCLSAGRRFPATQQSPA
jgi:hypothetical protein